MLIIDASVAVKFVTAEAGQAEALSRIRSEPSLAAPDWILAEVSHALWRKARAGLIHRDDAPSGLAELPIHLNRLIPSATLMPMALKLAFELDHWVYDSLYLACALGSGAPLLAADRKFRNAAQRAGYGDVVELLSWKGQPE